MPSSDETVNDTLRDHAVLPRWYPYDSGGAEGLDNRDMTRGHAWSGGEDPPAVGAEVDVYVNMIGKATVTGYWTEHGFLGVLVLPHDPAIWYAEQNGVDTPCHLTGVELFRKDPDPRRKKVKRTGRYRPARVLKRFREALALRDAAAANVRAMAHAQEASDARNGVKE